MASKLSYLEEVSRTLRGRIIRNSFRSGTPHLGSCLSCVDILTAAYFSVLKIDPFKPLDPDRDRFILSKGHAAPALFQTLALRGFFQEAAMEDYGENGSVFGEHPPIPTYLPGIEAATGSLGHGLPLGLGMAFAGKLRGSDYRTFVVLGDGECNEGSVWEAAMLAPSARLNNVTIIIDYNKWQATDRSDAVAAYASLANKFSSFGWDVAEIDGHCIKSLVDTMSLSSRQKPLAVVAHTIKGKGVSFMEDDNNWHYRIPTIDEVAASWSELGLS